MGWLDNNGLAHFWVKIKTTLANYALKSELPTKISDLTNDSNFIDTSYKIYATDDNNGTVTIHFGTNVNQ